MPRLFTVPLPLLLLALTSASASAEVRVQVQVLNRRIQPEQTLAQALHDAAVPDVQVAGIVAALEGVFDFRTSRPGDQLRLVFRDGEVDFFDYRQNARDEWQVRRDGEKLLGSKREIEVEKRIELVELTVSSSVYLAAVEAGEDPVIAMSLADVFAWDIDFYSDVRKGDVARVVVEKFMSKGRLLHYGNVLAASYKGDAVGDKRVFRYTLPDDKVSYFQEDGGSARKTFLKSPLKYANVTSRFGSRFHPVLKYVKAHNGVDYGAGIGTPVWAVGDGTVTKAGYLGPAGNTLCLRHINGFETCYLHLSRFGKGMRVGTRVSQKQVIAYTGNTGRTTGPHLHFAMKRHGKYINPLNQNFPRAEPVPKKLLAHFKESIEPFRAQLDSMNVAAVQAQ